MDGDGFGLVDVFTTRVIKMGDHRGISQHLGIYDHFCVIKVGQIKLLFFFFLMGIKLLFAFYSQTLHSLHINKNKLIKKGKKCYALK